jgi:putative phosphoribosyl transferase
LKIGYFGASTGAAAALIAAKEYPDQVKAVVSRGGRPDLAENSLMYVSSPTLFVVGGRDTQVIKLNQWAFERLKIQNKELKIVPGATHLFEEPGTLEEVARLAGEWFTKYLTE